MPLAPQVPNNPEDVTKFATITSRTATGTQVRYFIDSNPGFVAGDVVAISGFASDPSSNAYNGIYTIVSVASNPPSFLVNSTASGPITLTTDFPQVVSLGSSGNEDYDYESVDPVYLIDSEDLEENNSIYSATQPVGRFDGQLWFDTDDGNKLYRYNATTGQWVSVQDSAIATASAAAAAASAAAASAANGAAAAQATADGKNKIFRQGTTPTATAVNDQWIDTANGNILKSWNGTAWVSVQDTAIAAAAAAATAAQTSADGKNRVFRQGTTPTATAIGDIWFDTNNDNRISRWDGSTWVQSTLGTNALANFSANRITSGTIDASVVTVSNINAGNISTGTLNADRIASASITGTKIAAGTITASNIAAGTVTATQIAAGTITGANIAADTITGANIAAGTITAAKIAAGTITATQIDSGYVYAGTIAASQITAGTLTGFTVQTSTGSNAVIMNGANNALQFRSNGSVVANAVPLSVGGSTFGLLLHYGSTPNPSGGTYPQIYMDSFGCNLSASGGANGIGLTVTTLFGTSVSGSFTANNQVFMPNLNTTTTAANMRRGTGGGGQVFEVVSSSERFKENIVDLSTVFDLDPKQLLNLPVRAFSFKSDYLGEQDDRSGVMVPGFIAEEVDQIYPIAADYDTNGPVNWNDRFIIPGLLALIQDLYKEIELLKEGA